MITIECVLWGDSKNAVLTWTRVHTHITRFQQHEPVASILNLRIGVVFVIVVGSPICLFRMMMSVSPNQASMRFLLGLCWFVFNETQIVTVGDDTSSRRACESPHPNTTIIWVSGTRSRVPVYMFCKSVVIYNVNTKRWFVIYKRFVVIYNGTHCTLQRMVCKLQRICGVSHGLQLIYMYKQEIIL